MLLGRAQGNPWKRSQISLQKFDFHQPEEPQNLGRAGPASPDGLRATSSRKVEFWLWKIPNSEGFYPFLYSRNEQESGEFVPCRFFNFLNFFPTTTGGESWAGPCFSWDIPTFPCWNSKLSSSYKSFCNKTTPKLEFHFFPPPKESSRFYLWTSSRP